MKSWNGKGVTTKIFLLVVLSSIIMISFLTLASSQESFWDYIRASITGRATSQTFNLNISVGNTAPNITSIRIDTASFGPNEYSLSGNLGIKAVTFEFTVDDLDGYQNINTASAKANATYTNGSTVWVATNNSCVSQGQQGGQARLMNFTCTLGMWYFYPGGDAASQASTWNLTVYVEDNSAASGQNRTANFSYSQLKAFTIDQNSLTFASINPGATNTTATNTPIILNNTGNYVFSQTTGNISVNATNLKGETNSVYALYANNWSVGTYSTASINCGNVTWSKFMSKSTFVNITTGNSTLPYGNVSLGSGVGQLRVHPCLTFAGNELTSQAYSTNGPGNDGSWQIKIQT